MTPPTSISDSPLTSGGKPEILYIGAEFCPYCAAERWSLVVALSKFGNFTNLEYMRSALDDGNIATLSFRNSSYTSQYVSFVSVENEDRNRNLLQSPTQSEKQLWNNYNPNSYPFIDIGGKNVITNAQYSYDDLSGLNWTQIGSQLNNPNSLVAKAINGGANTLITAICKIDGGRPGSVCGQSFADLPLAYTMAHPSSSPPGSSSTAMMVMTTSPPEQTERERLGSLSNS